MSVELLHSECQHILQEGLGASQEASSSLPLLLSTREREHYDRCQARRSTLQWLHQERRKLDDEEKLLTNTIRAELRAMAQNMEAAGSSTPHTRLDGDSYSNTDSVTADHLSANRAQAVGIPQEGPHRVTFSVGVYDGEWSSSMMQGGGNFIVRSSRNSYEGTWHLGRKSGIGTLTCPGGNYTYTGSFADGLRNGKGQLNDSTCGVYTGTFYNGAITGFGEMLFTNGEHYRGEWYEEYFHGKGVYTTKSGGYFDGYWRKGRQEGIGKWVSHDGHSYRGGWKSDHKHGRGVYRSPDFALRGMWHMDQIHGRGVLHHWRLGLCFHGRFANGQFDGYGEMYSHPFGLMYRDDSLQSKKYSKSKNDDTNPVWTSKMRDHQHPSEIGEAIGPTNAFHNPLWYRYRGEWEGHQRNGHGVYELLVPESQAPQHIVNNTGTSRCSLHQCRYHRTEYTLPVSGNRGPFGSISSSSSSSSSSSHDESRETLLDVSHAPRSHSTHRRGNLPMPQQQHSDTNSHPARVMIVKESYTGEWHSDQKCGYGTYVFEYGAHVYEGEWLHDTMHGKGKFTTYRIPKKHYQPQTDSKSISGTNDDNTHNQDHVAVKSDNQEFEKFEYPVQYQCGKRIA